LAGKIGVRYSSLEWNKSKNSEMAKPAQAADILVLDFLYQY
jgi:hypothetical protein